MIFLEKIPYLYITPPHGTFIFKNKQKGLVYPKQLKDGWYYLVSGNKLLGLINLKFEKRLKNIKDKQNLHQTTKHEIISWWSREDVPLYYHEVIEKFTLKEPVSSEVGLKKLNIFNFEIEKSEDESDEEQGLYFAKNT